MKDITDASSRLVTIEYSDLLCDPDAKDLSNELSRAFSGRQSTNQDKVDDEPPLGIIAIRGIPEFVAAKSSFLPQGHRLAHLPPAYLSTNLSDPTSLYNAGWSHGKEKLGDEPDLAKASYYFNPLVDVPGTQQDRQRYPASYPANVWPDEEMMPGFEQGAKKLGRLMHEAVVLLSRHVDKLAEEQCGDKGYQRGMLHDAMKNTEKAKGRLLYYFPLDDGAKRSVTTDDAEMSNTVPKIDSWIGWHNDSGFLTALAGDIYLDHVTGEVLPKDSPGVVDPEAGLYVADRRGGIVHVRLPEDCMAVQIGECVQIVTGGVVAATPHCVKGAHSGRKLEDNATTACDRGGPKVARISLACFIDSVPSFPLAMPSGCQRRDITEAGSSSEKGAKVPPLEERWVENGMTFGDFLQKSFEKYYGWKPN